jgi:hypothetical protein
VLGAVLIGGFGVVQEPNHTLEDLIQLYKRPTFIVYFAVVEFFIVAGLAATHIVERKYKSMQYSLTDRTFISHPNTKALLGIRSVYFIFLFPSSPLFASRPNVFVL